MGKYSSRAIKPSLRDEGRGPHPIWRGIGCLMMILIPVLCIALAIETVAFGLENQWPIPYQLLGRPHLPDIFFKVSILRLIFVPITQVYHLYAYIAITLIYMIFIGGIFSVVYAAVYRMMGPPKYGPFDAPPPKIKTKRYTR
ncbi:MAG: hypothetical protein FJZ87_04475 [Chloroflexi bacterium]|nr:hypothetical protein [Chloroflexota bacterium]